MNSVEPSNNHIHSHECDHNDKNEDNGIITFRLGDENHPFEEDDEVIYISFKSTLKVIEFIGERIRALENLEKCRNLKKLLLRRNVIKKIENISHLSDLEELELYDNQLRKIENLEELKNLQMLDVSYNIIKKIEGLDSLTNLRVLYLVENRFSKVK